MPNPCGKVHMPNMPCRECDRMRKKAELIASIPPITDKHRAAIAADTEFEARVTAVVEATKAERLKVAREALTRAEISRRYREKLGDEYRERNAARMKARRAKIRGSPSE